MSRNHRSPSWGAHRSRRHAAFSLNPLPPPDPTPVPDDDDDFDWPGANAPDGSNISSDHAYVYAIAEHGKCFTALLGQKNDSRFKDLVTRSADSDVKQVLTRTYQNSGGGGPAKTWLLNPWRPGVPSSRRFDYIIDHVLYSLIDGATANDWINDTSTHGTGFNKDKQFFNLLEFLSPATVSPGVNSYSASGAVRAHKQVAGTQIEWVQVKVSIVGTAGDGLPPNQGGRRHFASSELASKYLDTVPFDEFSFGGGTPLTATETNGHPLTGGYLVAYGLYRMRVGAEYKEFFAVSPPQECNHQRAWGKP